MLWSKYTQMEKGMFVKILLAIYIFIFIFTVGLIVATHTMPSPALAVFRMPGYLKGVGPSLGLSWPLSLHIYHVFLLLFFSVILLNGISLRRLHVPKWRSICRVSSFLGLFLMWSVFLFFMLPLISNSNFDAINLKTSLIYSLLAFACFNINLLTFVVVQKERKEALRP